jgi:hypothetical protein
MIGYDTVSFYEGVRQALCGDRLQQKSVPSKSNSTT